LEALWLLQSYQVTNLKGILIMFDWKAVKTSVESARTELESKRSTIAQNKLRIEELNKLPPPRTELADMIDKFIDDFGATYPQKLASSLLEVIRDPIGNASAIRVNDDERSSSGPARVLTATEAISVPATAKSVERALFYILGDQIKVGTRQAIMEMEYPSVVGPAMTARLAEIDTLTQQNITLEADVEALEIGIREVNPNG
jgi:hypothetical protein